MTTVVLEATLVVGLGLAVDGLSGWALGHLGFISVLPGLSEAWGTGIPHTLDIPLLAVLPNDRDGRDGKGGSGERLGGCRSSFCLERDLLGHRCTGLEGPCGQSTDTNTGKRPSEHSVCAEALVSLSRGLWKCYFQKGLQDHRGMVFYAHIWGWLYEMSLPSDPQPPSPGRTFQEAPSIAVSLQCPL